MRFVRGVELRRLSLLLTCLFFSWLFAGCSRANSQSSTSLVSDLGHIMTRRQQQLLYDIDNVLLAEELRRFANDYRWKRADGRSRHTLHGTDVALPASVRILEPAEVRVFDDRIELDLGGAWMSFGIAVFREGCPGKGIKQLDEGIWFFSENGKYPPP